MNNNTMTMLLDPAERVAEGPMAIWQNERNRIVADGNNAIFESKQKDALGVESWRPIDAVTGMQRMLTDLTRKEIAVRRGGGAVE